MSTETLEHGTVTSATEVEVEVTSRIMHARGMPPDCTVFLKVSSPDFEVRVAMDQARALALITKLDEAMVEIAKRF